MNRKTIAIPLVVCALFLSGCRKDVKPQDTVQPTPLVPSAQPMVPTSVEVLDTVLTHDEAKAIAESDCIKGGESVEPGYYNENSKTWWFDANLNTAKEGCNPACVVSEDGSVEINWRCTGLIMDKEASDGNGQIPCTLSEQGFPAEMLSDCAE